jgi:hypothetical protein
MSTLYWHRDAAPQFQNFGENRRLPHNPFTPYFAAFDIDAVPY